MRHLQTEQYLRKGGYSFTFVEKMPITEIDMAEAKANPARLHRQVDEDRVHAYGVALLDGDDFPGIVCFDDTPLKHLVTGLHRLTAALDAEIKTFDCYLVEEHDEYRRHLLTRSINSIEGKAPGQREQLNHAYEVLRQFPGSTVKDVANAFNLKPEQINQFRNQVAADDRALQLGVGDEMLSLPGFVKVEVLRIASDVTFTQTVKAIAAMKLRGTTATDFAKQVRGARTEDAAAKMIGERRAEWQEEQNRAKARYGRTPTAASTRFMSRVRTLLTETSLTKLALSGIPSTKLNSEISKVEQSIDLLTKVLKDLTARRDMIEKAQAQWDGERNGRRTSGTSSVGRSASP